MNYKFLSATFYIVFLLSLTTFTSCDSKKKVVENKNAIDSISKISDPAARIAALDKSIADQPNNAKLYFERSKAYDQAGNLEKALENAKTAIEKDTAQASYYFYMSDLFMKKPSVKNALNIMERLKISQPKNKMVYLKLAELYVNSAKNEESLTNIEEVLKIDRNTPEAFFWRGYNFREMKMYDKAISNFQKAIELKPDYVDAYVILGLLYQDKKDPKAEEYFTSAIRINPKDTAALYDRGKYYQDMDSFQKAIDDYKKILDLDPNKRNPNFGIGYCLYKLKNYNDALGYFSKVLLIDPKDAAAHDGRSLCYRGLGDVSKANEEKEIADKLYAK